MHSYELSKITNIDLSFDHLSVNDETDIDHDDDGDKTDVDGQTHIDQHVDEKHVDVMDDDELDSFDIWAVDIINQNFWMFMVKMQH